MRAAPGDPGRCELIAEYFDGRAKLRKIAVYNIHRLDCGVPISFFNRHRRAVGGNRNGAFAAAPTFIRRHMRRHQHESACRRLCRRDRNIRQEGTSREYAPPEYPAAADFAVTSALVQAAERLGLRCHAGVVQNKDSFYGQHSPDRMPVSYELQSKWQAWKKLGVLASEMESAALFTVAAALGARCGTVLHVIWNQERKLAGHDEPDSHDTGNAVRVAIVAIKILIERDSKSGAAI